MNPSSRVVTILHTCLGFCCNVIRQAFRPDEAVDVSALADGSGYSVGWTRAGEYLRYTVDVEEAGEHRAMPHDHRLRGGGVTFGAIFVGSGSGSLARGTPPGPPVYLAVLSVRACY